MHAQNQDIESAVTRAKKSIVEQIATFYIEEQNLSTSEDRLVESILKSITDRNLNAREYESLALLTLDEEDITNGIMIKMNEHKSFKDNAEIWIFSNKISSLVKKIHKPIECELQATRNLEETSHDNPYKDSDTFQYREREEHQYRRPPELSLFTSTPKRESPGNSEEGEEEAIDCLKDLLEQPHKEEEIEGKRTTDFIENLFKPYNEEEMEEKRTTDFIENLFRQACRGESINYEESIDTFAQQKNGQNDLQKLQALTRAIDNENDPIALILSEIQTPSSDDEKYDFDFTFIENFLHNLRTACQKMMTNHKKRPHSESQFSVTQGALKKQTRYQPQRTTTPEREFNALIRDKLESFREELKIMVEVLSKKLFIPESQINEHRNLDSQFCVWIKKLESFSRCAHMCKKEDFILNDGAIRIFKNFLKHFFTEDSILSAGNADLQSMSNTMHERQFHSSYNKFLIRDLVSQIRLIKLRCYLTSKGKQNKLESEEVEKFIQAFKLPYEDEMLALLLTYFPETENSISSMPPFRLGRMNINGQDIDLTDLNDHQAWNINTCQTITQIQENRQQYDWGNASTEMRSFRNKLESRGLLTAEYPSAVETETVTEDPTSQLGFKPIGRILG
ncbi:MAG: hypothetical protein VX737_05045 [Pseudomonadota bacterium]|nr:hypothetical protein [Pseudomonadota bacterium]